MQRKRNGFLESLQAHSRVRVPYPAVVELYLRFWPEYDEEGRNYHQDLMRELETMAQEGLIKLPAAGKKNWNKQANPNRPAWVHIPKPAKLIVDPFNEVVSWRPELAEVQQLLRPADREVLARINQWLIKCGGLFSFVPHRERALEIFGDEHFFDDYGSIRKGGLFGGKVSLELFGALDVGDPLPFDRPPDGLDTRGRPVLLVENQHSFWSFKQINSMRGWFSAVAYSAGKALLKRAEMLDEVGDLVGSTTFVYLGDIDPLGLEFPYRVDMDRRKQGLSPLRPAKLAYRWLINNGKRNKLSEGNRSAVLTEAISWLEDMALQSKVNQLFRQGQRVPQESLGYEQLDKHEDDLGNTKTFLSN